ncbi:hypothetical protein ACP4OV_021518 [Aristida adscensionis]
MAATPADVKELPGRTRSWWTCRDWPRVTSGCRWRTSGYW